MLRTDVLHEETVILIRVGDVVAAELHAVGGPHRGVIFVKETLPVRMDIFRTLLPFVDQGAEINNRRKRRRLHLCYVQTKAGLL